MRAWVVALVTGCAVSAACAAWCDEPAREPRKEPVVEMSQPLPPARVLGTTGYKPTATEAPFLKGLPEEEAAQDPFSEKDYTLTGKTGKPVGWFGIVREKKFDEKRNATRLLLEMKYFDGMTDLHIHVASIYGAGDFTAELPGNAELLAMLDLVRIYGKVAREEKGIPEVAPEYVRVWDWGLFTFMDYGKDKSNPRWVKLRKVTGPDVYSPRPTKKFYEDRLGPREGPPK